jgi:hypothetical protein
MRRLLIALVVVVSGCGDGYETVRGGWGAAAVHGDTVFVGLSHSGSLEPKRVTIDVDGSVAAVGIHAEIPSDGWMNADRRFSCFRIPVDRRITRVVFPDGRVPRPDRPRGDDPSRLRRSIAHGACDDIGIDRSGDGA